MEPKTVRFDAHFHPQTSRFGLRKKLGLSIEKRLEKWWKAFRNSNIQVIVSTEHAYVNPAEGYYLMRNSKPEDYGAVVVPGLEAVSKEGIDVLVWSRDESIFEDKEVMVPFTKSVGELVDIVSGNENYQGCIPHSFGITPSAAYPKISAEEISRLSAKLGVVEAYNFAAHPMFNRGDRGRSLARSIRYLTTSKGKPLKESFRMQNELNEESSERRLSFIVGNDAHNSHDVRCYGLMYVDGGLSIESAFRALQQNKNPNVFFPNEYSRNRSIPVISRTSIRILEEVIYLLQGVKDARNGDIGRILERYEINREKFKYGDLV